MAQTPSNGSTLLWLGLALPLACSSSGGKSPPSEEARPDAAEPGACFGKNTTCQVPEYVPLAPGPEHRVQCVESPDLTIAWQANLGMLDCRVPDCPVVNPLVATGGGRHWGIASVLEPGPERQLGGFAVFEFDDTGALAAIVGTDIRSPLEVPLPPQYARAIQVDAGGSLRWVTPTVDRRGLEFRRYEHGPRQVSSDLAVGDAYLGHAKWNADGSSVLAYRYVENLDDAAGDGRHVCNIARFDRNGGLLWNQTLRSHAAEQGASCWSDMRVAGLSADGEATLRSSKNRGDLAPNSVPNTLVTRLDADGNVAWARELENSLPSSSLFEPNMRVLSDGSSLVAYGDQTPAADGSYSRFVEKLDAAGQSSWRARLDGLSGAPEGPAAFDDGERVILVDPADEMISVAVFDVSQFSCTRHKLRVERCEVLAGGGIGACDEIAMAAAGPGRLYFGIRNQVGIANLP